MISTALEDELLALVPARDHFLGLMTSDPMLVADPLTVELASKTYSRLSGMVVSSGTYTNSRTLYWYNLPRGAVVFAIAAFDEPTNGNMLYSWRVGPHSFPRGGYYRVSAGGLTLSPQTAA